MKTFHITALCDPVSYLSIWSECGLQLQTSVSHIPHIDSFVNRIAGPRNTVSQAGRHDAVTGMETH